MNRGAQAKIFIFIFLILVLSFTIFAYSSDERSIESRKYAPSTSTVCKTVNGKETCNLVIYSGVKFIYEDNEWKDRKNARSFIGSGIKCVVDSDGSNLAECIDYNETSRTIKFSTTQDLTTSSVNIPLRKYHYSFDKKTNENIKNYTESFERELTFDKTKHDFVHVFEVEPVDILEFGEHSTTIQLQDADSENLEDTYIYSGSVNSNYATHTYVLWNRLASDSQVILSFIKFNISAVPLGATIDNANLSLYFFNINEGKALTGGTLTIEAWQLDNQTWWEGDGATDGTQVCFSSPVIGTGSLISSVDLTATERWYYWDVKTWVQSELDSGNKNVSFYMNQTDVEVDNTYAYSKEHATASTRPYLNIIYTPEIVNLPPVINLQAPENNTEQTPSSVEFVYNVTDPDGDDVDNCSLWLNKDQTGFIEEDFDPSITQLVNQSFPPQSLGIGNYTWKVSCYDNFTKPNQGNSTIYNLFIYGINVPPTIDVPSISPDPAYTDSTLQCSTTAYDVNLDSITIKFDWYNGTNLYKTENKTTSNGTLKTSTLTPPEIQNKDETWNCTVRAFDGQNYSSLESDTITILNSIPTHSKPVLSSTTPYNASNEDLTCYNQNTQDLDNDEVTNIYSWFVNSNPLAVLNLPFEINADDYSGSDNDGTINGDPQYVTGKYGYGQALEFDGIDDKVTVGDISIPANGPATIEAWFYFKQLAQGSTHKGLHSILYQHSADNNLYFPGTNDLFYVASYLQLNTWHHLVLTYSGDTSTAKLYIDNTQYNVAVQGDPETIPVLNNFIVADTGSGLFFNGSIDEVKVYNRVLSSSEITEHFNLNYNKIVSSETSVDDIWKCKVVPNDGTVDGSSLESNPVTIEKNVYDITFNITEGELGNDLTAVDISCDNGWSVTNIDSPYDPVKFYEGSYSCELRRNIHYNKTITFTADSDKQLDIIMSLQQDMTIQEHNWLEAIYTCLYEGDCLALDLLEQINETTEDLWREFKPTDETVVLQEDPLSLTLSSTQNITINYTIRVPPKAGYSDGDWLPIRIAYWFLDENNESCLDQDKITTDINRAESTYCTPLIAKLLGRINQETKFIVDLQPNLPDGTYTVVSNIEIDPNQIWIKYSQKILGEANILESNDKASIFLIKQESFEDLAPGSEVKESSGLTYVTGLAKDTIENTVNEVKSLLSGSQIVAIIGMICGLLTIIVICFTIYKIKTK